LRSVRIASANTHSFESPCCNNQTPVGCLTVVCPLFRDSPRCAENVGARPSASVTSLGSRSSPETMSVTRTWSMSPPALMNSDGSRGPCPSVVGSRVSFHLVLSLDRSSSRHLRSHPEKK
jgi:hypothetical protein